jgi:hypothetical protein
MQLLPVDQANTITPVATLAPGTSINSHTVGIQGAVASYNQINNGQIKLELVDMDDKTTWTCYGDGKKFSGTAIEFGLNTALQNDEALGGGLVGGFALKKLKNTPSEFKDFDFDKVYKAQYDNVYLNNNNNNNDTNITLESIATEFSPGTFVINADVNILSTQSLFIQPGQIVTTFNNFTNNGTFNNQGTFCTTKIFTNNDGAKFDNTRGYTLNYLGGTLIFTDPKKVDNRENGKIINLQSIYDDKGGIIGNQVITIE